MQKLFDLGLVIRTLSGVGVGVRGEGPCEFGCRDQTSTDQGYMFKKQDVVAQLPSVRRDPSLGLQLPM